MFRQGPSELPETYYKYKLNISLKEGGAELELKKRRRAEDERGSKEARKRAT